MTALTTDVQAYVQAHLEELIALTGQLCAIPAPSHHEERRAEFCLNWLFAHGMKNAYVDEVKNVVWPWQCEGKDRVICIAAHTDTVFPDTEPFSMEIRDGKAFCPAVGDDTVNVAILMLVMAYVAQLRPQCKCGLLFVLNSCEEGLGNLKGIRQIFADWAGRIGEFISLDGNYDSLCVRAVGSTRYRVSIETEGGHSFVSFGNRNAIEKMAKLIELLYAVKPPTLPGVMITYNVGEIRGGTSVNSIAQHAEMLFEYRADAREGLSAMRRLFDQAIERIRPECVRLTVETLGERPCSGSVDVGAQNALILRAADIIKRHTGERPALCTGSTDCNWPLSLGIPAICFGGYLGQGAHTREEYIELDSLPVGFAIIMELILSYVDIESADCSFPPAGHDDSVADALNLTK